MKPYLFISFLVLLASCLVPQLLFGQVYTVKFKSVQTGEPIPFRKISYLPSGRFTSTDIRGDASLDSLLMHQSTGVMVSGFALTDTILEARLILANKIILLNTKDIMLNTFEVNSSKPKVVSIGNQEIPVKESGKVYKLAGNGEDGQQKGLDMKYGAWVKLPKGKERYLSKVSFCVGNTFKTGNELVGIRIMGSYTNKKLETYQQYSLKDFYDLPKEPTVVTIVKNGWQEHEFGLPIPISEELDYVLVLFDLLKESNQFSISTQNSNATIQRSYYSPPNMMWIEKNKTKGHPAIMIEFLLD